ncbi:hypothetical protein RJ640_013331 [Escallonia rubra]|uniref:Uncharacterized protein n=1 Tax=Escallonia rubra TaxID=112253 RepID=A0AA88QY80_9ASTE|nr:hypothetical protein RJ640_013331 [Escallonia rubra]
MDSDSKILKISLHTITVSLPSECRPRCRVQVRSLSGGDSTVASQDSVVVNGVSAVQEKENFGSVIDVGNGQFSWSRDKQGAGDVVPEKLEALWDDGYGTQTVKDYLDIAKEIIKPDGGPPRWFCPVSCGQPLKDSPVLLFLPGMDGLGLGLILHHKSLGRSQLLPLLPFLEALPDELHIAVPYLLSSVMGDPVKMAMVSTERSIPPAQLVDQLSGNLTALLPRLSGLADIIPKETLLWKLKLLRSAAAYANSRLHAITAEVLVLARWFRFAISPVTFSTMEDGKIVRGLAGVPNEGPVLLVGYHMLMGVELAPLVVEFLKEKNVLVRGLAHPDLFSPKAVGGSHEYTFFEMLKAFGALPVTASNLFKLLSTKSHALLYPGGAREALHNKGEEYKLFWPDRPEFVRMAAKFGATIVPFGVVGEDDLAELVLDYHDIMRIPVLNDYTRKLNAEGVQLRAEMGGEIANQNFYPPGLLPKVPGRFYYLFGKPIQTKGMERLLKDRESAKEMYLHIKSEVESSMAYLIKKREEDPYRGIVERTVYRAISAPLDNVPTFKP